MTEPPKVRWVSGETYEFYMGRWSRLAARDFLGWLDAPAGLDWLDVGCGTGALTEAVATFCAPGRVMGIDPSAGFLDMARERLSRTGATLHQADAQEIPYPANAFDRVVSGLMLNFVPDQPRAAAEMVRVVRSGGEVALYVWDYAGRMELMRRFWDAAVALNPGAREKAEATHAPICRPDALQALFDGAGLIDIETRALDVPTVFGDFDDYWSPFLGGQSPAPAYCMSLDEDARTALREHLRETLPTQPDGSIHLVSRAWALRGRKP
ncbi:class I SAM-dependent methyltransferase [Microvirga rosea]|uniref:class I SAM-dependent methyltransferase n=1 Tax=Microvirga rosea TaxID=2715425 RepID=UPI001D09BEA9|nr:class I SAM-dependent methyltransferase [Microvirga rosea]MCB8819184.1 class I SAM-dependent methyltransferase [Microvirga rosea]